MIIRPALPEDADRIYELMREVFGQNYLSYTVYQIPVATAHIARTIARGFESSREFYAVASMDKDVIGYYNGVAAGATWFLSYIGVSLEFGYHGIGSQLLNHFEAYGRNLFCDKYGLDVFARNQVAVDWYSRRLYAKTSASFLVRMRLQNTKAPRRSTFTQEPSFLAALAQEREVGFSKCAVRTPGGEFELGLIAGHTCKLLGLRSLHLEDALGFLERNIPAERHTLILSGLSELPWGLDMESYEEVYRMEKPSQRKSV